MSEKEYIVSLNKGVNYEAFNQEMIASTGGGDIPGRSVDVANARPLSQRNTHYMLTDEEAAKLSSDTRVLAVELRPDLRDDIDLVRTATQTGDFTKTTLDYGNFVNWGLRRMNEVSNPYTGPNVTGGYDYTLDGTGVDIVIQDSGVQVDHPEFYDYNGTSRVQQINWYTESGLAGSQSVDHYRDYDGHGTHVAGIASGLTYGWAKGARIYAVKVSGLEGSSDSGTGIPVSDCFDVIKGWHANKPVDPATGQKRPTIVNMSWGYGGYFTGISGGSYRGTSFSGAARRPDYGMVGSFTGIGYRYVSRVASVDVDVQELIDAGVHVVIAAGNSRQKIDVDGGLDYDNYFTRTSTGTTEYYYNRGGSPFSTQAHIVGNIDTDINSNGLEQKAESSETGPGVTVYAPGTNVMSSTSTINRWGSGDGPYPGNSSFTITNISGTSMASPQVAGLLALYTQLNPSATPEQGLAFINTSSGSDKIYTTGLDNDYTDSRSILSGNNRFAFNKFNSATQMTIGQTTETTELVPATYALTVDSNTVNESGTFTVTLTTTNVATGTSIPYTISGVTSEDIADEQLSGIFTISNNTASKTYTVTADETTEGTETFELSLTNISESVSVTFNDTSTTPVASYTLDVGGVASINEGSNLTVTLTTVNVTDDTLVPYTISGTGITTADIGGNALTGDFTVINNTATLILPITSDATTEGLEAMTIGLNNGESSVSVNINDTSVAGAVSYTLTSNVTNVDEGGSATVTLTTTNIDDATSIPYTITGVDSADISGESLTGNFTITNNTANLILTLAEDSVTEGAETLVVTLNNGQSNVSITINDTSTAAAPTFALSGDVSAVNEGGTVSITLTTTATDDATTVPYTITGIDANDLTAGSITGDFTITSNTDTLVFTFAEDVATEGTETMNLALDNGQDNISITVNDTSIAPAATYALANSANTVNEGDSLTITLTTENVDDGTSVPYTISGVLPADIDDNLLTGNFTVNSDTASLVLPITADQTTEGSETLQLALDNGEATTTVTINDTSTTPAADYTITVTASSSSDYTLSGTDRGGAVNGTDPGLNFNNGDIVDFNVNASGHPFWIKTAAVTGTGSQATGVTNGGTQNGTVRWIVGSTGTFYYICQYHGSMVGTITVS